MLNLWVEGDYEKGGKYEIDWGDTKTSSWRIPPAKHTYAEAGDYEIKIKWVSPSGKEASGSAKVKIEAPSGQSEGESSGPQAREAVE